MLNWWWRIVVLEKTLESPFDCKEIKPVTCKGNQSWIFLGRTDAEAEATILWPPDVKLLIGKDPDAGEDWRQEEKGMTEDEMVAWHHQLNGHEFEQVGSWGWTGKPGVLQSMGLQRVGHDWVTELNWYLLRRKISSFMKYKWNLWWIFQKRRYFSVKYVTVGFPGGSVVKNPPANAGDMGLIPGSGRSLEEAMATHFSILAR